MRIQSFTPLIYAHPNNDLQQINTEVGLFIIAVFFNIQLSIIDQNTATNWIVTKKVTKFSQTMAKT